MYAYSRQESVLQEISFTFNPGDRVALMGATGSKKSYLVGEPHRLKTTANWEDYCQRPIIYADYLTHTPTLFTLFIRNIGYYIHGFVVGVLMSVSHKYTVLASISLSIALFITSCSENKVSQCQRLIRVVNAGTSLIDKNKGTQVITSIQLSKDLEFVTKSIKELNLKDPKLKEFQSGFVKIFQNLSQAIAIAARALDVTKTADASASGREKIQKERAEIDSALTTAITLGKQSDTLINQMNKYCSQPE